eukprot:CAMPEP_0170329142 /NCGR_PEP_ID=MMETSP0116_2-20130129/65486_1 /TAXON_ID=400756 /ORGANISM="Durinskia baltica, Strain CSIRO CS-38" /LENGTH=137 /DNA_ID=CAMNT_0010582275 /DNA_START=13 /DNA_END=426 /DNA_ORIENTATION=-
MSSSLPSLWQAFHGSGTGAATPSRAIHIKWGSFSTSIPTNLAYSTTSSSDAIRISSLWSTMLLLGESGAAASAGSSTALAVLGSATGSPGWSPSVSSAALCRPVSPLAPCARIFSTNFMYFSSQGWSHMLSAVSKLK